MKRLKASNKPCLSLEKQQLMKQRVMSKLGRLPIRSHERDRLLDNSLYSLAGAIRLLAQRVSLLPRQRAVMKEKILATVEIQAQKRFFWSNFFGLSKKLVSGALLVMIVAGMGSFLNVEIYMARASTFTLVDSFSGQVTIQRDGVVMNLEKGMPLMENDEVITGADGSVVIRYFDDSVSRLASNTKIIISKLEKTNDVLGDSSYVEVSLLNGAVWSRVLNLVESKSSYVVKAEDVSAAAKKGAFNVEFDNGKVQVGVFNHTVDISTNGNNENVFSGEKMVFGDGKKEVRPLSQQDRDQVWVKENMQNDQAYLNKVEQQLLEAKRKAVGLNNSKDVSYGNSLQEDTLLFLTFDDVKKKKLELDLAERNFVAAQVKLSDPNISDKEKLEANKELQDFGDAIKNFYAMIAEVEHTDKNYAKELRDYVGAKILTQKKDLSVVLPDSPTYVSKKILDEAELLGANNQTELVQLKVDQATDKLSIAEDAKDKGNAQMASQAVAEYNKDMTGVMTIMNTLPAAKDDVKDKVAEKVSNNTDLLQAINVEPPKPVIADRPSDAAVGVSPVATIPTTAVTSAPVTTTAKVGKVAVPSDHVNPPADNSSVKEELLDRPLPPLLQDIK